MDDQVKTAATIVWDYMQLHEKVEAADCLVILGSRDDRVASYAAQLAMQFTFADIIISGGAAHHNDLLVTSWAEPTEAEHFLHVMRQTGMTQEVILEKKATNTGENAIFSYELLKKQGKTPETVLIVTKPYMERRAKATFAAQWPYAKTKLRVTSPELTLDKYVNDEQPLETVINIMVGDMQRIIEYPKRGLQVEQPVPDSVIAAHKLLIGAGYTKHLIS